MRKYRLVVEFDYTTPDAGTDGVALRDFFQAYLEKHPKLVVTKTELLGEEQIPLCWQTEPIGGSDNCHLPAGHDGLHHSKDAVWAS